MEQGLKRVFFIVIDGLGVGAQEDAFRYGDADAHTLKSALIGGLDAKAEPLTNFAHLGLGTLLNTESERQSNSQPDTEPDTEPDTDLNTGPDSEALKSFRSLLPEPGPEGPSASTGKMREVSAGKDSTTGHWELAGIYLAKPFPTYPQGFPPSLLDHFCRQTGVPGVLCNQPYSGTDVIRDFGEEHQRTGHPIVYTSADSVFQIAAHTDTIPLETLYEWCRIARETVCTGDHEVGRVIARPFAGTPGAYERIASSRKDYSSIPPKPNLLSELRAHGIRTLSIGKVADLFAGEGFDESRKTTSNRDGLDAILQTLQRSFDSERGVLVFVNLIDTDQLYGHRQDPVGYYKCLQEIDEAIPAMLHSAKRGDLFIITGDHGNDPGDQSTDHTREFVPLLVYQKDPAFHPVSLGTRDTFSDVSASILHYFSCDNKLKGRSFL